MLLLLLLRHCEIQERCLEFQKIKRVFLIGSFDAFDLHQQKWWSSLSQQQLQALLERSEAPGITAGERELVARFVAVQRRG